MSNEQPDALLLADWLEDQYDPMGNMQMSAVELRRLHSLNSKLLEALESIIEDIDSDFGTGYDYSNARAAIAAATVSKQ